MATFKFCDSCGDVLRGLDECKLKLVRDETDFLCIDICEKCMRNMMEHFSSIKNNCLYILPDKLEEIINQELGKNKKDAS